ncbi:MAG TPA: biotin synthase BioB [bacterium]|nr:biotin synthase BioB [bacterium]
MLTTVTGKALRKMPLSRDEAREMLTLPKSALPDILQAASRVRRHFKGDTAVLCSIVNAKSGKCSENCIFCAQSAHHKTAVEEWPLKSAPEIAAVARTDAPYATLFGIVTSGRALGKNELAAVEKTLHHFAEEKIPQKPCGSLGILTREELASLKAAGLRRYHHNLEVSRNFFPKLCTTHTYDERVATVRAAQAVGLETCVGGIFGVGESAEDRIDLLFEIAALAPDSVPLNFLVPIAGTPVGHLPPFDLFEAVKLIALARFIMPDKDIKVGGGRIEVFGDSQALVFLAGANSIITGDLLTVKGRRSADDIKLLEDLGLAAIQG